MKKAFLSLAILSLSTYLLTGQTNIFPTSGNVGIGTTNPHDLLEINQGHLRISHTGAPRVIFNENDADYWRLVQDGGDIRFDYDNNDTFSSYLTGLRLKKNGNVIMNGGGNVGIGTANPSAMLDVVTTDSHLARFLYNDNATDATRPRLDLWGSKNKINIRTSYNQGGAHLSFGTYSVNDALFIHNNGNIGIGTTDPGATLDVNGKIRSEKIEVISDVPSSDYVFEPDYNLRSLKEVEQFVIQNKHLPEVPSAEEFKANGYSVGEMDDLLLRKIEELTLYIIEQEKRNTEQQKMIDRQQQLINELIKK